MGAEQDFLNTLDTGEKPPAVPTGAETVPGDTTAPTDEASFLATLDQVTPEFKEDLALSATPPLNMDWEEKDAEIVARGITDSSYMKSTLGGSYNPSAMVGSDEYAGGSLPKALQKNYELVRTHYDYAKKTSQMDDLYHELLDAKESGKSTASIEAKIAAMPEQTPPQKPVYPWEKAAAFTAGQVPIWADIGLAGVETGMAMSILGGTAGAVTTGGPGAVPGAGLFYAAGQTYGSGKKIWQIMEGNSYREMLDAGVDEKWARKLARYGVGPVSAGLNILSFGMFKKMAPVAVRKLMGAVTTKTSKGIMKGRAGKLLMSTGTEVVTEDLEEINQIIMTEVGINLTNELRKAKGLEMIPGITRDEFITRIKDVTEATLYATFTLGGATTTISYGADKYMGVDSKKDDKENVIDMTAHMMDKTTDQQREEVKDSGAIILGVEENEEGEVTGMLMADRKSGEIFETGPNPTAEEIYTQTGKIPQVEIDVERVIETGDIEAAFDVEPRRTISPGELVNGITRKAAGTLMADGDEEVLSHIREGIAEHGVTLMQDAIRNQAIAEVAAVPKEQRAAVRERIAKLQPQIDEIFTEELAKAEEVKFARQEKPLTTEPPEGQYLADINAEIEFEKSQDNMARAADLEAELRDVAAGKKKASEVELWRNLDTEEMVEEDVQQIKTEKTFHAEKDRDTIKQERERTFEPKAESKDALPDDVSKEFHPLVGGKYFYTSADSLQEWLDKNGDGFLYRVTIPAALKDGFDVGLEDYKHQFPTGDYKSHTFTSSLDNARDILKDRPGGIVYRVMPQDVDSEFTIHVHDNEKGVLHVHSPKPAHIDEGIVIHKDGQWKDADRVRESRRLIDARRAARAGAGRQLELRPRAGQVERAEGARVESAPEARSASEIITDINQAIGETGTIGKGFSPQEVNQLFTELAQNSWDQGIRTFKEFSSSVKDSIGKAWDAIKETVKQAWGSVVEFNKRLGEVGAVGKDIAKEKLKLRADTVQGIKSLAEQVRAAKEAGDGKLAASLRTQLVDLIGKAKSEAATAQISTLTEKERVKRRRQAISTIRDYFGLTDNDLKKISRKDVRLMSKYEFKKFKDDIQTRALEFSETRQAKIELLHTIHTLNLQKVDNFRAAMDLPPIRDMSLNQLRDFDELIGEFHEGDSFLNKRQLETVDRTFLEGIRTWREAKAKLAEEAGVPVEELDKIQVSGADNFKWDNSLYESNPFYRVLVTRVTTSLLDAQLKAHNVETDVFDLAKKAQKSVKRSLADRAIPNDKQIFDYLEASKVGKEALGKQMTSEQIDLAHYMQEYFAQALTYLLETKSLSRGRENYFVHMRRTLLESVREDGLVTGVKEMFKNYEQDQMAFNILDDNTGNILPLEKFFQFSLQRSGALTPTKNIVRAFLTYANTFEKKVALDGIIPAMSIYAQSLTPTVYTQKGLEIDQSIKKFVNQYINNKKGRRISYDSVVRQGGKLDLVLNSTRMLVSMLKLGFSPIAQTAAPIGEQSGNLIMMGVANQAKGTKRMATKKGKAIIEKYEAVVGRSLFETLTAPGEEVTGRITSAMFAGFHASSRIANAQYLLGMMTDQEYESGTISTKRLAELELEKGRFRAVPGTASLVGSTSPGKLGTQFKSWAIPVIRTTLKDLVKVTKDLKKKPFGEKLNSREAAELLRISALTATVLAMYGIYQADDDDDSLMNKMVNRVLSEASLIYSAFDVRWMLFTTPPAIKWTQDLGMILADMAQLVEYKDGSGLKGPKRFLRHFTPGFVKSFQKKKKKPKY